MTIICHGATDCHTRLIRTPAALPPRPRRASGARCASAAPLPPPAERVRDTLGHLRPLRRGEHLPRLLDRLERELAGRDLAHPTRVRGTEREGVVVTGTGIVARPENIEQAVSGAEMMTTASTTPRGTGRRGLDAHEASEASFLRLTGGWRSPFWSFAVCRENAMIVGPASGWGTTPAGGGPPPDSGGRRYPPAPPLSTSPRPPPERSPAAAARRRAGPLPPSPRQSAPR